MMHVHSVRILLLILTALFFLDGTCAEKGEGYRGKVVGVSDGDTFTLLTSDKRQLKIRLSEIDAPEIAQPYGSRSKQALSELIFSKEVLV